MRNGMGGAAAATRSGVTPLRALALAVATGFVGLWLAFGVGVAPALAHANLVETTPGNGEVLSEAPTEVELQFSEGVQLLDDAIRLYGGAGEGDADASTDPPVLEATASGERVTIALPAGLADGAYAVSYRVVSADGHPVGGVVSFQVGEGPFEAPTVAPPANQTVAEVVVSALTAVQYIGLLLFAGLLFFDRVVLGTRGTPDQRTGKLLRNAFGAAVFAAIILLPASASRVTGNAFITFELPHGDFIIQPFSAWWAGVTWQVLASAIAITVLGAAALATVKRAPHWVSLGLAGLALATPVLVGHTQTIQPLWMMMIADLGHLAAGAFWAGGIAGLLRYLIAVSPARSVPKPAPQDGGVRAAPRADPHPTPRATPKQAAQVVVDFSRFALISVIVLAVSGALMAVLILSNISALFTTDYGRTLLIKLGIVAAVIVLAAWNRARLIPRLMARPDEVGQWISLRCIMIFEAVLLACVLTVTGFLSNTSPNAGGAQGSDSSSEQSEQPAQPTSATPIDVTSQGLTVTGEATSEGSAPAGEQTLHFTLEYEGEALTPPQHELGDVAVDARLQAQGLGPLPAQLEFDEATGEYVATLVLPATGEWQVQVAVRVDTYAQPIALFTLDVS